MGEDRFARYLAAFDEEPPVSLRINPRAVATSHLSPLTSQFSPLTSQFSPLTSHLSVLNSQFEPVPWCRHGYYLAARPNFTFDPLFHAGCYYVQEAASMFLDEVLRQHLWPRNLSTPLPGRVGQGESLLALDLCAAPGGKSTLLRSALFEDSILISNEPVRQRASILLENVQKWGYANHFVTSLYPRDIRKSLSKVFDKQSRAAGFDLILCDVPCSGEGMFRKDEATIREWSLQNVEKCWRLQREIVSDAWACLNDGGLLIYSTCTFNTKENEENIRWLLAEHPDAHALPVAVKSEWGITGSLLEGFTEPVYRFIPGITSSEGLFVCAIRKGREPAIVRQSPVGSDSADRPDCLSGPSVQPERPVRATATPRPFKRTAPSVQKLPLLEPLPLHCEGPVVELTYAQAMAFLRREALVLPADVPRGLVEVAFMGHPLGMVKNLGTRANNLYPKEWRIKSTHLPADYEPVLRLV